MIDPCRSVDNLPDNDHKDNHSEHDRTDNDHEVDDFSFQWSEPSLWSIGHLRDLAEHSSIAS